MQIYDFSQYKQNDRVYSGMSGRKIGITINGEDFLVKFPGSLKNKDMRNITLSYTNSPVCEYIGSHVYQELGIPVHETYLGFRGEKQVVACKDFLQKHDQLQEFGALKITMDPAIIDSLGNETDGLGLDLQEALFVIRNHPILSEISVELEERFWDMFVVDALIGNPDRNNQNWGIIKKEDGTKILSPVYDNGNCLNNKWSDEKMKEVLNDEKSLQAEAYKGRRCIFTANDRKINPYQYMFETNEPLCIVSVLKLVPLMEEKIGNIFQMIEDIPPDFLSDIKKDFFKTLLEERLEAYFVPLLCHQKDIEAPEY